jgi:hypothetical protein
MTMNQGIGSVPADGEDWPLFGSIPAAKNTKRRLTIALVSQGIRDQPGYMPSTVWGKTTGKIAARGRNLPTNLYLDKWQGIRGT